MTKKTNPFDTQVGGSHYKQYKIQPYEFFHANQIPHHKAAIIRRILRYDHETGKGLTDLEKIKHEVDLIIKLEHEDLTDCQTIRERKDQKEFSISFDKQTEVKNCNNCGGSGEIYGHDGSPAGELIYKPCPKCSLEPVQTETITRTNRVYSDFVETPILLKD